MHLSGAGLGEIGHGQGPGAGPTHGGCNPRKFSEKIALHNQRQAEETAAFREVMMDITSIRVQAERVRQTSDLPYYGGSLPNVNQMSRYSAETQYPRCLTQRLLEADEEYRDIKPSPLSRPHRRHFDSAPYLSSHLSPPQAPTTWRRNWSSCSATEKSQMVHLPLTALNRTNSDSALHTSVRNTQLHGPPKSTQTLNPQTRHCGFAHPAPLIEENIQEESRSPKLKKLSSMVSSGCEAPVVHSFPSADQQVSSALSTSGSLPDLSSLHLPSPLPAGLESEPHSRADHLKNTSAHPDIMADFNLTCVSSPLQASLSNPLLQSSLSNPSIQSCLSCVSLPSSLSSASSRLSLSNSSLQSSLSNQSLRSSLSSSSLSNQSVQSSASRCSLSSGVGGSGSCSSSSSSPRIAGGMSRKRAQLSPLIVPSGGESRWQHPKQFSPTASPTLPSIAQGALLSPNKVLKETKPPAYPCSHHIRSAPPLSHQPLRQYFQPEPQHQSIPEMEQWVQNEPQHHQTHSQRHQHHVHKHPQHHSQPHAKYEPHLQYHSHNHPQQAFTQHPQLYPQIQRHHTSEEQHRWQHNQYQNRQLHQNTAFPSPAQEESWTLAPDPHEVQHTQVKRRYCMQTQEEPKPQSKVVVPESQAEGLKLPHCNESEVVGANLGLRNKSFELNKESYVGLHLTPSQAKALSQQLGDLQKEPLGGSKDSELHCESSENKGQQNQSCTDGDAHNVFSINLSDPSSWLDQDISGLPDSVLEFDLETFDLDSNLGWP